MKILLTGASGFLGSRIYEKLKNEYEVIPIDRSLINIYDYEEMIRFFHGFKSPMMVVHTAAVADTSSCEENKALAFKVNVVYTKMLASLCNDFNIPFVFISSDQVYDYFNDIEHFEYAEPKPTNYYGLTKLWAENEVRHICPSHFICRITWQYDIRREDMPNKGFLEVIYNTIKDDKKISQSPKSNRYITWVYATIHYIEQMINGRLPYGTYNVASVTKLNCYELYKYTFDALGVDYNKYLKKDSKLRPINLTPFPYTLKALGAEILNFEETLDKVLLD